MKCDKCGHATDHGIIARTMLGATIWICKDCWEKILAEAHKKFDYRENVRRGKSETDKPVDRND